MQHEEVAYRFFQRNNRTPDPGPYFSGEECFSNKDQQFGFFQLCTCFVAPLQLLPLLHICLFYS